jgi:predicted transcriptional regulator
MMTLCDDGHVQVAYNDDDGSCPACSWKEAFNDKCSELDEKCSELDEKRFELETVQNKKDELVHKVNELKDKIDELESPGV